MPSLFGRILLFLSSYAPLFVILSGQNLFLGQLKYSFEWIVLTVLTVLVLLAYLTQAKKKAPDFINVVKLSTCNKQTISYMVIYLMLFLSVGLTQFSQAIFMEIFFLIVGYFYVKLNLIYLNPVLILLGFNLFKIEIDTGEVGYLISKSKPSFLNPQKILVVNFGRYVWLEK